MNTIKSILFRFDESAVIGTGHYRRCNVLAHELKKNNVKIHFIGQISKMAEIDAGIVDSIRFLDGNGVQDAREVVEYAAQAEADVIILDNYAVDEDYQHVLSRAGCRWLQFSGKPDQKYWADWVLSLSPASRREDYERLAQQRHTRLLLGPEYAILDPRFASSREKAGFNAIPQRLTLTFGGGDDRGAILFCLDSLREQTAGIEIDILVGSGNPNTAAIRQWIDNSGRTDISLHIESSHWADIMAISDMAITAGGMTTFEMAFLGIPTLIIQIAENQQRNAEAWDQRGVGVNLGALQDLEEATLRKAVAALYSSQETRRAMRDCGRKAVDGMGARRIVKELFGQ